MKKVLIFSSAFLIAGICVLNVHLLTKSKSAQTAGIVLNKALASGEYDDYDDDYIMNDDDPYVLPPFEVTSDGPNVTITIDPDTGEPNIDMTMPTITIDIPDHVDIQADPPSVVELAPITPTLGVN